MLQPNTTLQNNRYRIIRLISQGGMGTVYEAYDNHLHNRVAIKEALFRQPSLQRAFEKEAQRLDRLRHIGLPKVKDYFVEANGGRLYLVMEYIEGQDLAQMLAQQNQQPFTVAQVLAWADELLDALAYLHARGIVHRDIKPANLKQTPDGEMVLLDFGLAKGGLTQTLHSERSLHGYTSGYAPLEQVTGQPTDARSDIYALGATLYSLLTGKTPEGAQVRQQVRAHGVPDPVPPANQLNPQVPTKLAQLLTRMMALQAEQRPSDAQTIRQSLAQITVSKANEAITVVIPSSSPSEEPPRSSTQGKRPFSVGLFLLVGAAVMLFVIVLSGVAMLWQNNSANEIATGNLALRTQGVALQGTPIAHTQRPISPDKAAQVAQLARFGKGRIHDFAYSPDGEHLAVASSLGIYLYEAASLQELDFIASQTELSSVAFSPDGELLAFGSADGAIELWNIKQKGLLYTFAAHTDRISELVFYPDGAFIASASFDSTVAIWQVADGSLNARLTEHNEAVTTVAFSPDGQWLATGSFDKTVHLWSFFGQTLSQVLEGHTDWVSNITFSPNSEFLVSASPDQSVRFWAVPPPSFEGEREEGELLHTLDDYTHRVESLAFSDDGQTLVTGSYQPALSVWHIPEGKQVKKISLLHEIESGFAEGLEFSPDGQTLAVQNWDTSVYFWQTSDWERTDKLEGYGSGMSGVAFSPDSQTVAASSWDTSVYLWHLPDGTLEKRLDHNDNVLSLIFAPDGKLATSLASGLISLWAPDHTLIHELNQDSDYVGIEALAFTSDSSILASGSTAGKIQLWNPNEGTLLETVDELDQAVHSVAFSPDGELLAAATDANEVPVWDLAAGTLRYTLSGHGYKVCAVAISPNGQLLASGGEDDTIRLWRLSDGALLRTLQHNSKVTSLAFSPDSSLLLAGNGDKNLHLWDSSTSKLLQTLSGHTTWVASVAFSPNGEWLASTAHDNSVRLWGIGGE